MQAGSPVALVVGGTGFIGSHVTREFIAAGWDVVHFGPPGPPGLLDDLPISVKRIDASATEPEDVGRAIAELRPEVIISALGHNANATGLLQSSEADFLQAVQVNAMGLRNVLEAAHRTAVPRVVWTSSVVAYGPPQLYGRRRVIEADVLRPVTSYGLTKALAEQFSLFYRDARGLDACALRIPLVFGPGRWYGGVLGSLMSYLSPHVQPPSEPLHLPSNPFDLVYVRDVADAVLRLAKLPKPLAPAYNLSGFTTSFEELLAAVGAYRADDGIPAIFASEEPAYPLMSDELIRTRVGFACKYDLGASLRDLTQRPPIV